MRWDRFFDDLEDQIASEWEAERASLDVEAERLRLSQVSLRARLAGLVARAPVSLDLADGSRLAGGIEGVGADWVAVCPETGHGSRLIVPLTAVVSIGMPRPEPRGPVSSSTAITDRLTFGFVMRDLVRRRAGVSVGLVAGRVMAGTIDQAGLDHLDLAQHDRGAARRAAEVTGYRVVPFASIAWVRVDTGPPA